MCWFKGGECVGVREGDVSVLVGWEITGADVCVCTCGVWCL